MRKKITEKVIKQLYAKSGNQCAFPGCGERLFNEEGVNLSNICHIEAAEKEGQRYNENSTDDDKRSYENLILLCPKHHKIIDEQGGYTVEELKEMKRLHEIEVSKRLSEQNLLSKYPSILNKVISSLAKDFLGNTTDEQLLSTPQTEEKIKYNNIKIYQCIFQEYRVYQGRLSKIYEEIERQGSMKKDLVLKNIRRLYLKEKGRYNGEIALIRDHADTIIEHIEEQLWAQANEDIEEEVSREAIEMSINVILTDAFIRCEILDAPDYDSE